MIEKESLIAVGWYAFAAIGIHLGTMLINAGGHHNTSLPFAAFVFLMLGRLRGKNRKATHMVLVLSLMLLVSLSTIVTHWLFPARANWYDGVMGFGVGSLLLVAMEYFTGNSIGRDRAHADHET